MRADAQRNAEKLRAAAAEVFRERGLQAPLKEIARRAGVSHGTLYNLFGTREALIDEVAVDLAASRLDETAEQALARDDAWDGFAYYVEKVCELQATEPAIGDVVTGRYPGAARLMALCDRTLAAAARVIERAQRAGSLRTDFTREDLLFLFSSNALLARAARHTAPDAWRRGVAFLLDGLRTEAAHPLPVGPLSPEQHRQVLGNLTGTP
ncbi:TetR/AcrR family transcriptional regulator [Streptomyces sp. 4N509B]|uniref:TetR/AcrR family transcriptional regulator n=1 Tax=Streptomyces sp. 4N509B TaxID=3457413 RepID=UPI003FD14C1B